MGSKEKGFSLMEVMVSMAVMVIITASVFQLLSQTQARSVTTATIAETTAMARESVDLMVRELRLAGYPPPNSYPSALGLTYLNSEYVAGGILAATPYSVQFEAATGDFAANTNTGPSSAGVLWPVVVFDYELQVPPGSGGACAGLTVNPNLTAPALMRSALMKPAGGGAAPPAYDLFLGNVMNCALAVPIFTFCPAPPAAAPAGCPTMPQVNSALPAPRNTRIVMINLQARTPVRDPATGIFRNVELFGLAHRVNPDR